FFFSSRRRHTRFDCDWSSDVCSSDLERDTDDAEGRVTATSAERPKSASIAALLPRFTGRIVQTPPRFSAVKIEGERAYDLARERSEERRVGKECRTRGVRGE